MLFEMVKHSQVIYTALAATTLGLPVHYSCLGTQKDTLKHLPVAKDDALRAVAFIPEY